MSRRISFFCSGDAAVTGLERSLTIMYFTFFISSAWDQARHAAHPQAGLTPERQA
jgi:hypothetical protein